MLENNNACLMMVNRLGKLRNSLREPLDGTLARAQGDWF